MTHERVLRQARDGAARGGGAAAAATVPVPAIVVACALALAVAPIVVAMGGGEGDSGGDEFVLERPAASEAPPAAGPQEAERRQAGVLPLRRHAAGRVQRAEHAMAADSGSAREVLSSGAAPEEAPEADYYVMPVEADTPDGVLR